MEVVQHISPRAEQLLSEYGLGHVRAEYRDNLLKKGLIFTALLPVGLVMLGLTLPTLLAPALTDGNWWQRMGGLTSFLLGGSCFSVLGLIMWLILPEINNPFFSPFFLITMLGGPTAIAVFMFFILWCQFRGHTSLATPIRRKIVVSLYERGLVYHEGRKVQAATWEQLRFVERLALPREKLPRRYYKLVLKDATEITLPMAIAQLQDLAAAIEGEMMKRLLPGVLADYDAHKPVTFLGFCLTQDGVSKSDEYLPWMQIEQVSLADEKLTIKEKGVAKDWFSIPAVQVRNMCVLEALLVRIREDQGFRMDDSPVPIKG